MGTKNNPGAFDCYHAAADDEPMFILLGRDPTAPLLVALWMKLRIELGDTDNAKLLEAGKCSLAMNDYAEALGKDPQRSRVALRKIVAKLDPL